MSASLQSMLGEAELSDSSAGTGSACCLTEQEIVALLEPKPSLGVSSHVDAHLAACPDCRDLVLAACLSLDGTGCSFGSRRLFCLVFEPGSVVARRYCIRRLLGRGGMGEVYEAFDLASRMLVALKAVRASACDQPAAISRLFSELRLGRRVSHANVCRMLEFGQHRVGAEGGSIHFYTMQLINGETLRERLKRGPLDLADTILLGGGVLSGLRAIHDARIVHRDLKSDNLMLGRAGAMPSVTIIDFGLARRQRNGPEEAGESSNAGSGSLAYMAPERAAGQRGGPAADIFSLGVVLFEAVTGHLPFEGPTAVRSSPRFRCCTGGRLRLGDLAARAPAWFVAFIDRCLQTNPADRFADAAEAERHFERVRDPLRGPHTLEQGLRPG